MATSTQESALKMAEMEMELDQKVEVSQGQGADPGSSSQAQLAHTEVMDVVPEPESTGTGTDGNHVPTLRELANLAIARAKEAKLKKLKVMSNKLVLEKIAKSLSSARLQKLRRTCTTWNSGFVPQLKKTHFPVRLNSFKARALEGFGSVLQSSSEIPFTRFVFWPESKSEDENEGVDGVRQSNNQNRTRVRDRETFQQILLGFGNRIKSLDIGWGRHTDFSVAELRKLIFEMTPELDDLRVTPSGSLEGEIAPDLASQALQTLPKLKRITVNFNGIYDDDEVWDFTHLPYAAVTQLMTGVIAAAHELEALDFFKGLECIQFYGSPQPNLAGLLKSKSYIHKLKTLTTSLLTDDDIQMLIGFGKQDSNSSEQGDATTAALALCLESFTTSVFVWKEPDEYGRGAEEGEVTLRFLCEFLASQSRTLKELTIEFEPNKSKRPFALVSCVLPPMEKLRKLSLVDYGLGLDEIYFRGRFMDAFPQLNKFACSKYEVHVDEDYYDYYGREVGPPDLARFHHPGVTHFHLTTYADGGYTAIQDFRPVFPSLAKLQLRFTSHLDQKDEEGIHIDVKEVAKIWNTWPALTVIRLTWKANDLNLDVDCFLSGVSRKKLELLRHRHKHRLDNIGALPAPPVTPKELLKMVKNFKTLPGIHDLKQLQEFKLNFVGRDKPQLTDMGGYFGLALASGTLQRIVIQGSRVKERS